MALEDHVQQPDSATPPTGDFPSESFPAALRGMLRNIADTVEVLKDAAFGFSIHLSGGNAISHEKLMRLCGKGGMPRWGSVDRILRYLENPDVQPNLDRAALLNQQEPERGRTLLHQMCMRNAPPHIIERALRLGADPNAQTPKGDSPFFSAYRAVRTRSQAKVIDILIKGGADLGLVTATGASVVSRAFFTGDWNRLSAIDPAKCTLPEIGVEQLRIAIAKRLELSSTERGSLSVLLQQLDRFKDVIGVEEVKKFMNTAISSPIGAVPLLHVLCTKSQVPAEDLDLALKLGADPKLEVQIREGDKLSVVAPIHLCASRGHASQLGILLTHGVGVDSRTSEGFTPFLLLCARAPSESFRECATLLIAHKADLAARTSKGVDCVTLCLLGGNGMHLSFLKSQGLALKGATDKMLTELQATLSKQSPYHFGDPLRGDLLRLLASGATFDEIGTYLAIWEEKWTVRHSFSFGVSSKRSATKSREPDHEPINPAFTTLLPRLLFGFPAGAVNGLIHTLGSAAEYKPYSGSPYHPYEAEFVALLNHPKDPERRNAMLLTDVISAIPTWIKYGVRVTGTVVNNWADIGLLTFSFPRWKYDAQRLSYSIGGDFNVTHPSLFEQYSGFTRIQTATDDTGKTFGPGFELKPDVARSRWITTPDGKREQLPFDQKTRVIFFRGGLVASHPTHGTIIVRNSSIEFGRDLIPHPCMWHADGIGKRSMTEERLRNLTPQDVREHFSSFLDPRIYRGETSRISYRFDSHLHFLLSHLRAVSEDYSAWKFDTKSETAWQATEFGALQSGGHFSSGFRPLVRYLEGCLEAAKVGGPNAKVEIPDLGFAHPDLLPWGNFEFKLPSGESTTRLKVTPRLVEVLTKLCDGVATDAELKETGLRTFFQQAGFNKQGELVLLRPERAA